MKTQLGALCLCGILGGISTFGSHAVIQTDSVGPALILTDSLPARWVMEPQYQQTLPTDDSWWKTFRDPVLDVLIAKAEEANYDIRMSQRRISLARLGLDAEKSGYYPAFSARAGWEGGRNSGAAEGNDVPASKYGAFSIGADMQWEIDIFGRINAGIKAKKASWQASRMEFAGTLVSVAAQVAQYYFQLRENQQLLEVLLQHVESQKEIVRITKVRFDTGLSSMLDVTQANIVLYSTEASIPTIEANIQGCINNLSLLLSTYPSQIQEWLCVSAPLPDYVMDIPIGVPADLIRRRPDVVQAEYELAAEAAQVGIAKKDFLPTLSLSGTIGTESKHLDHLFRNNSFTWSVAPTLTWTIFDGMARNYQLRQAREQMQIAFDDYNLTLMTAVHEVDNALIQYAAVCNEIGLLEKVTNESRESLQLSLNLYKDGLSPFNDVMTAQETYLSNETSLTQAKGEALIDLVTLYRALGGGWDGPERF